jgi:hypothetical protein
VPQDALVYRDDTLSLLSRGGHISPADDVTIQKFIERNGG